MKKTTPFSTLETPELSGECIGLLLFVFVFGLSTGVFFEVMMPMEIKADMQSYLEILLRSPLSQSTSAISGFSAFVHSAFLCLFAIGFIGISGYTRFAIPASFIVIFLKGVSLGYSCALILEAMNARGIFVIMLSLIPQHTLLLPILFIASCTAISNTSDMSYGKKKGTGKGISSPLSPYLYIFVFLGILSVVSCILQSIFLPIAASIV